MNAGVPQKPILASTLFLPYILNDPFNDVICNIAISANGITLCCKFDLAYDLWQQPHLASKLESDLGDTTARLRMWIIDSNAG